MPSGGGGLGIEIVRVWPKEIMFTARADVRGEMGGTLSFFAPKWKETETRVPWGIGPEMLS